jgi:outer membrane protein TolC
MTKIKICLVILSLLLLHSFTQATEKKEYTLPEIVELALANNPLLAAKKSEVFARKAGYEAAKRLTNPKLEFNVGKARSWEEDREKNTGGISLNQHLENPFKRHYRIRVYEKEWEAAEFSQDILALEVTFTVKNLYFEILRQKAKLELARKNLNSIQKIHRLIEKRAKLGEIKELESIRLYVESLKAQRERDKTQTVLYLAREKLNQYLGHVLPPDFQTTGTQTYRKTAIEENTILEKALTVHPKIREKETRIDQARSHWSYAKWQRLPDFTLSGFSQNELDGRNTGFGVSLDIPLWNFNSKEMLEAENLTHMEEEELRALRMEVTTEVKSGINQWKLSEQSLQIFHQGLLEQAEESLKIAEVSYTQGEISLIDYLDSQRTYYSILNDYQDSLYQWNADKAALEKVLGEEIK